MSETAENLTVSKNFKKLRDFKLLEDLPDSRPIAVLTYDEKIIFTNKSFELNFHLKEDDNIKQLVSEPSLSSFMRSLIQSKYRAVQIEAAIFLNGNDTPVNYIVDCERVILEGEEFLLLLFSSVLEKKIIESKINLLHNALDSGGVPVLITDSDGRITYMTHSFETVLDKKIENVYRLSVLTVFEELLDRFQLERLRESLTNHSVWEGVAQGADKAGSEWYKEIKVTPVITDHNLPTNFIVTVNDITVYVRNNQLIKSSADHLSAILDNISDPVLIVRMSYEEYLIDNANRNFLKLLNAEKAEIVEKTVQQILEPVLNTNVLIAVSEIQKGIVHESNFRYSDSRTSSEYIVKVTSIELKPGVSGYFILSMTDITEQIKTQEKIQRAYEKEMQLNRLKSAFLANMSHEIRTPSVAIIGYANLLCDDIEAGIYDSVSEMVNFLRDGIKRLLKLIDDIVEVSMLESGDLMLDYQKCRVSDLLHQSYQRLKDLAKDKNVSIYTDYDEEELEIETDPEKFKKIVESVIDNAIKYNVPGGKVFIKTVSSEDSLTVYVSDTGRGIDEKKIDLILQPFMQEEEEGHKRRFEGAGLGLTIANGLTKALKGELKIKSRQSEGTTVVIKFPAYRPI